MNDKNPAARLGREGLGRSRSGLSTKIHLAANRRCRPVARILSPGQHGDCPWFIPLMQAVRIARRGLGRPRSREALRARSVNDRPVVRGIPRSPRVWTPRGDHRAERRG